MDLSVLTLSGKKSVVVEKVASRQAESALVALGCAELVVSVVVALSLVEVIEESTLLLAIDEDEGESVPDDGAGTELAEAESEVEGDDDSGLVPCANITPGARRKRRVRASNLIVLPSVTFYRGVEEKRL